MYSKLTVSYKAHSVRTRYVLSVIPTCYNRYTQEKIWLLWEQSGGKAPGIVVDTRGKGGVSRHTHPYMSKDI